MAIADNLVFVSYRRADSSAAARWLAQSIGATYGSRTVFIDTESIRMGDDWANRIESALHASSIVVPVIGASWLRIADQFGRRRLDKPDDWVRNEISHAITEKKKLLPILLSGTTPPMPEALPPELAALSRHQMFELRDDRWQSDLTQFLTSLSELGLRRLSTRAVRYPRPKIHIKELTEVELSNALQQLGGKWRPVDSELPGAIGRTRTELHRVFEFASFDDAIGFMGAATKAITEMNHHPRWENLWRSVSVWLSTWDVGHVPSQLDVDLAMKLEALRKTFPPAKKPMP